MENAELCNIMQMFDPSVTEKFQRCSKPDWCKISPARNRDSRRIATCTKLFVLRAARKLVCMRGKLSKIRKAKFQRNKQQPNQSSIIFDQQILKGSNTPASSRPSSLSITMDQIECLQGKHSPIDMNSMRRHLVAGPETI
jgi:hypothetical protein